MKTCVYYETGLIYLKRSRVPHSRTDFSSRVCVMDNYSARRQQKLEGGIRDQNYPWSSGSDTEPEYLRENRTSFLDLVYSQPLIVMIQY